jgi:hypothetical protein
VDDSLIQIIDGPEGCEEARYTLVLSTELSLGIGHHSIDIVGCNLMTGEQQCRHGVERLQWVAPARPNYEVQGQLGTSGVGGREPLGSKIEREQGIAIGGSYGGDVKLHVHA